MTATAFAPCLTPAHDGLHTRFLAHLPRIETHARIAFRDIVCANQKADLIAETLALSWAWYCRLAQRGKDAGRFISVLAAYAARAARIGRRVCGQDRAHDVLSHCAQRRYGFKVESLPASPRNSQENLYGDVRGQRQQDVYEERLQENVQTPILDQVQFRIDFSDWLATLTARERQIIRMMARNERTKDLSRRFDLSEGRISQLRREFSRGWQRFVGDVDVEDGVAVA